MNNYIISCELYQGQKQQYDDFFRALESYGDRCHALENVWFISTESSAERVYFFLRAYLDPNDTLMVERMPVGQGWSGWVRREVRDWLTEHIGPP
jgi:hypothetical protein